MKRLMLVVSLLLVALLVACSFWVSGEYVPDELTPEQVDSLEKANGGDSLLLLEEPELKGDTLGESYP